MAPLKTRFLISSRFLQLKGSIGNYLFKKNLFTCGRSVLKNCEQLISCEGSENLRSLWPPADHRGNGSMHKVYVHTPNLPEVFQPIRGRDWDSEPIRGGDNFKKYFLRFVIFPKTSQHTCFLMLSGNSQIWHLIGFHPRDRSNIIVLIVFISTNSDPRCFYDWPACLQAPLVLDDQVIFCLTVSLDKLPASTLKAKVRNIYRIIIYNRI